MNIPNNVYVIQLDHHQLCSQCKNVKFDIPSQFKNIIVFHIGTQKNTMNEFYPQKKINN